jgi:hypothetical protein
MSLEAPPKAMRVCMSLEAVTNACAVTAFFFLNLCELCMVCTILRARLCVVVFTCL